MPTLVLPPPIRTLADQLARAAQNQGWAVERMTGTVAPAKLWYRRDLVLFGETPSIHTLADALNYVLFSPTIDWLVRLPEQYRLREITLETWATLRSRAGAASLLPLQSPASEQTWDEPDKAEFTASPAHDDLVQRSEPVIWLHLFRFYVQARKIRTYAPSAVAGRPTTTPFIPSRPTPQMQAATQFVERLLADETLEFPPAFVLDVGEIEGRGVAIHGVRPAWCQAFGMCDSAGVLATLQGACASRLAVTPEDRRWVVDRYKYFAVPSSLAPSTASPSAPSKEGTTD